MKTPKTFLFSPADSRRKIEKGASSAADALLLDLEDAVALSMKEPARGVVRQAVNEIDFSGKRVLVRLNSWSSGLTVADVDAVALPGLDGVVLPKVESAADIQRLGQALAERQAGHLLIYALLETARGLIQAPEIAAVPGLQGLMFGGEDFIASIGGKVTAERSEILYARSALVTAARAYELEAVDTIFIDLENLDGLEKEARLARSLGFSGKLCIHPQQVAAVHRGFQPTDAERAEAEAIVTAYEEHTRHGIGVFSFEGRMIDEAIARRLKQLL